jgi:hypothetical protein
VDVEMRILGECHNFSIADLVVSANVGFQQASQGAGIPTLQIRKNVQRAKRVESPACPVCQRVGNLCGDSWLTEVRLKPNISSKLFAGDG